MTRPPSVETASSPATKSPHAAPAQGVRLHAVLRWTARVWSIASFLLLLAFAFGGSERFDPTAEQAVGLLLFPGGVVAGFAVAWWRPMAGGAITVISLAVFYVWLFQRDGRWPTGPWFLLLAAPGFLHVAGALLARSRRRTSAEAAP